MTGDVRVLKIEDLRAFAIYLHQLSENMINEFSQAHAEMIQVNEVWGDIENERFMEVFTESLSHIHKLSEMMEAQSIHLMKKWEYLDMYKNG